MTCVSKEYEIETKLEQEQWGGSTGEIFLGGRMSKFSAGGGDSGDSPIPQ